VLTENVMGEDVERVSARLLTCAILNDVDGAQQLVLGLSREQRAAATRYRRLWTDLPGMDDVIRQHNPFDDIPLGETALSIAIRRGSLSFVKFLVDECNADVEQHKSDSNVFCGESETTRTKRRRQRRGVTADIPSLHKEQH